MAVLIPTKKIPQLTAYGVPLAGTEMLEIDVTGTSRRITARDFVLPIDSILTVTPFSVPGSNARQLVSSPTVQVTDGGPGGTLQLDALITGAFPGNPTALVGLAPVNGAAVTWMRSDAAPALDQGIAPTWTALHTFNLSPDLVLGATFIDQAAPAAPAAGRQELFSSVYGTSGIGQLTAKDSSAALIALGYETHVIVYNNSGAPLVPGSVVYVSGTFSGIPTVALARANSATTMPAIGIVQYLIPNNSYGRVHAYGPVTVSTIGFTAGQTVYLSDAVAGGITNTAPTGTNFDQALGTVAVGGSPTGSVLFSASKVAGTAPSTQIGLTVVNGVAATFMRSDAAPALSQAIAPTWTGQHIFGLSGATNAAILASSAQPQVDWDETDAAANNRRWRWEAQGEQFLGRTVNDANSAAVTWIAVDRTLNVVDTIALTSTSLTWNGNPLLSTATAFANPTGTIGLVAVNGVATTAMRSDAAPPLSQSIAPTWTAQHIFSLSGATNAAIFLSSVQPQTDWNETDGAANNRRWRVEAQGEQFLARVVDDANSAAVTWLAVDRTGTTIDLITLAATALTCNSATTWTLIGSSATPTMLLNSNQPYFIMNEADAAANNRRWYWTAGGEAWEWGILNDANSASSAIMTVQRTGTTVDSVTLPTATASCFILGGTPASLTNRMVTITGGVTGILGVTQTGVSGNDGIAVHHQATAGDNSFMQFGTEAAFTTRGSITYNRGGGVVAYNTTSDARKKKNIRNSPDPGNLLDRIQVRAFEWMGSDIHVDYWFVAQELYDHFPMAVSRGDDDRDWAIDPSKLIPLMVKELQSLRGRVADLEAPGNSPIN